MIKASTHVAMKAQNLMVLRVSDTTPDGLNDKKFRDLLCVVSYSVVTVELSPLTQEID